MADWIIRRGIPLTLVSGYLAAVALSRGNPSAFISETLEILRATIMEFAPQIL